MNMNKLIAVIEALPKGISINRSWLGTKEIQTETICSSDDLKALVAQLKWIPVSERLPTESGHYCTTRKTDNDRTYTWQTYYNHASQSWSVIGNEQIVAWMQISPYTAERGEGFEVVAQLKQLQNPEMENTGITEYRKSEDPFI